MSQALPSPASPASPGRGDLRLRTLALPLEHGSWGLALEPLALGLLAVPSWQGTGIALGAFFAFLSKRPLEVVARDGVARDRGRRTWIALSLACAYGILALAAFTWVWMEVGAAPFLPLLLSLPLALVYAVEDARRRGRSLLAEMVAPLAFAAVPAAMVLAAGAGSSLAGALAVATAGRSLPSILYLRSRLRLERHREAHPGVAVGAHVVAMVSLLWLIHEAVLRPFAAVPYAVLLGRAAWGLSPWRSPAGARRLGLGEIAFGVSTVVAVAWSVPG